MKEKPSLELTPNQITSLHPVVRLEFKAGRLSAEQARKANRLIRRPYAFISRIALRAVRENIGKAGIEALRGILSALPKDAPAGLLETASFAVLRKKRPLAEAAAELKAAAENFRGMREAAARRKPKA